MDDTTTTPAPPKSRRAVLRAALGATAGAAAATLVAATPALANDGDAVKAGNQTLAESATEIKYDGPWPVNSVILLANDTGYTPAQTDYPCAVAGWAGGSVSTGVYGFSLASDGIGVIGVATGTGGTGVVAHNGFGTALAVEGVATFTRSGRASIPRNRAYVDITVPGGIGAAANILATIQMNRPGVWVTGVRRNYPVAGKARIHLNKVASTTAATPVAWFVIG